MAAFQTAQNFLVADSDYVAVMTEIDIQTPIPSGGEGGARRSRLPVPRLPLPRPDAAHLRAPDHEALEGARISRSPT